MGAFSVFWVFLKINFHIIYRHKLQKGNSLRSKWEALFPKSFSSGLSLLLFISDGLFYDPLTFDQWTIVMDQKCIGGLYFWWPWHVWPLTDDSCQWHYQLYTTTKTSHKNHYSHYRLTVITFLQDLLSYS